MKIARIYNWTVFSYLALITLLTLNSNLTYGYGLGDLAFVISSGLLTILQVTITLIIQRRQKSKPNETAFYICGTVFLLTAIFLTYEFTFGRGSEYIWNGVIFYKSLF